jgi:hypothetical protein
LGTLVHRVAISGFTSWHDGQARLDTDMTGT